MTYHQDWLMRQIEAISATLAYMLTGKKPSKQVSDALVFAAGSGNTLAAKLRELVQQHRICEGEDLLFAAMEENDPEAAEAAVQFYADANTLSDGELEQANFSRTEIKEGLEAVCAHYGLNIF